MHISIAESLPRFILAQLAARVGTSEAARIFASAASVQEPTGAAPPVPLPELVVVLDDEVVLDDDDAPPAPPPPAAPVPPAVLLTESVPHVEAATATARGARTARSRG